MERWLPVVGYVGRYEVSDHGRVRNTQTGVIRVLSVGRSRRSRGRCQVDWKTGGRKEHFLVHHLVLEAFVGPRPEGAHACHRDDNPSDNRLENLYWGTPEDNMADKVRNKNRHKTHPACKWGHDFGKQRPDGARNCEICITHKHRFRQGYYLNHPQEWPNWLGFAMPSREELLAVYRKKNGRDNILAARLREHKRVV